LLIGAFLQVLDIQENSREDARLFLFLPTRQILTGNDESMEPHTDLRMLIHKQRKPWNKRRGLIPLIYQPDMVVDGLGEETKSYF
jgi:hypothetical protein